MRFNTRSSLATRNILGLILLLALFAAFAGYVSYQSFANTLYEEYTNGAFHIAEAGVTLVDGDMIDYYRENGSETSEYRRCNQQLDQLCNSTGATFIYVIQPDLTDYGTISFLFSTVNHDTDYSPYEIGYLRPTTNEEYRFKYRALYELGSESELLLLNSRRYAAENNEHITAMVPLKNDSGETKAILCVQLQMDVLEEVRYNNVRDVFCVLLFVTVIAAIMSTLSMNKTLIQPIERITNEASRFAEENVPSGEKLSESIRTKDEIGVLASSIDSMEEQIIRKQEELRVMTKQQERIGTELHIARSIQREMLPSVFPPYPERRLPSQELVQSI